MDTSVEHRRTRQRTSAESVILSLSLFAADEASTSSLGPSRRHVATRAQKASGGSVPTVGKDVERELNEQTGKKEDLVSRYLFAQALLKPLRNPAADRSQNSSSCSRHAEGTH